MTVLHFLRSRLAAGTLVLAATAGPLAAQRATVQPASRPMATPATVAGSYRLFTINGQPMPAGDREVVSETHTMRIVVDSGRARLARDGRFTATVTYRFWWQVLGDANEWIPSVTRTIDGRWELLPATQEVAFYPTRKPGKPPKPFYGQLDGNRIRMAVHYKGGTVRARDITAVVRKVGP